MRLRKSNKEKCPIIDLNNLFHDILTWCDYSGANLSPTKNRYIHLCRKHNCQCTVLSRNINLFPCDELKILGIIINKRYRWNSHIDHLSTSLVTQLNIVKCLSSPKFQCDTQSILTIVKTLFIPKISYGIFLYGYAPNYLINKIKSLLNAAIRTALGALRSTPIANLFFESRILNFENQRDLKTAKLFKAFITKQDNPLYNIVNNLKKRTTTLKIQPAISRTTVLCSAVGILLKPTKYDIHIHPPWSFNPKAIDTSLHIFNKNNTNPIQYHAMFNEVKNKYSNYTFIYTDGSKINQNISYSITLENEIIKISIIPYYSSIYSAEIIAISEAINLVKHKRKKVAICSDSLSALNSIANINNSDYYPNKIRHIITQHYPKIILIWVPGHNNIVGNSLADQSAKQAHRSPVTSTENFNLLDIKNHIKQHFYNKQLLEWNLTNDWYKNVNYTKTNITDFLQKTNKKPSRLDIIKFERLRLGHTKITHGHLMNNTNPLYCTCNTDILVTVTHLLLSCPLYATCREQIFTNTNPISHLSVPSLESISLITKFLKRTNLYHKI